MEYPVEKVGGSIDDINDETFGDGAITGDWESAHYSATAEMKFRQALPGDGQPDKTRHVHTVEEVEHDQEMTSVEQKIKELWPSSPQAADATGSIWSSPKLPTRLDDAKFPSMPSGNVISLEELEREMTESSPSLDTPSLSPAHQSQTTLSPSSLSPAHMTTHPAHVTPPPPGHMAPYPMQLPPHPIHGMPPPGSIQPYPLQRPPSQMPHPHFLRGGMQQQFPWLMRGNYMPPPPPPGGLAHIPPPNIPLLGPHIRPFVSGQYPPPPHAPPHGPPTGPAHPPLLSGPYPGHPLFFQHQPQEPLRKSKRSEYLDEMKTDGSGFMTQKEKEWVIRIQLVQLQSQDPDNEDYYYQNYKKRQALRLRQSQSPCKGESPDCDSPRVSPARAMPTITTREYKPTEFQGALGKLTVSSIAAPRKMIDIPLGSESGGKESEGVAKDSHKKRKHALIVIEKMYDSVLLLEDLDRKSQLLEVYSEGKAELVERKDVIVDRAYSFLRLKAAGDTNKRGGSALLQLIMNYRKGKRVICRILPFLRDGQAFAVVEGIICHLPAIIKKDSVDLVLPELTTSVMSVVSHLSFSLLLGCLAGLLETLTSTSYVLRVCLNEFSGRMLMCILDQGHKRASLSAEDGDETCAVQWTVLVKQLHSLLVPHGDKLASKFPVAGVNLVQFIATLT